MKGTENDTKFWVSNATSDSSTENRTFVTFTYTSVAPAVHYGCDNYNLFMGFFVKVTIVLVGTIGNILTIFVLWGEKKKTGTAFLLVALAFADTSVLIVWGWMDAMPALMTYWNILSDLNRIWGYFDAYMWALGSMTHLLSTWLVTMVTVLRYIAVCHPLKAGKWISVKMVRWQTFICVVTSVVFYLPRCFEYGVKYDATNDRYVREKRRWARGETYNLTYKVIIYYLFIYLIPLSLLIYCTCQLIKSLKGTKKKKEKMTANKQKSENKKRIWTLQNV